MLGFPIDDDLRRLGNDAPGAECSPSQDVSDVRLGFEWNFCDNTFWHFRFFLFFVFQF